MYTINKRGPKRYVVQRQSDRKQIHKGSFTSKAEAKLFMQNQITEISVKQQSADTFIGAFEKFVEVRMAAANNPKLQLTKGSVENYAIDLKKRIKPCLTPNNLLLSDFNKPAMNTLLENCAKQDDYSFKRVKRMVNNIKSFLRWCDEEELKPNLSTLNFDIEKCYQILPSDYNERFERKTNIIDEDTLFNMLFNLQSKVKDNFLAARKFAIVATLTAFGFRKSELQGLKVDAVDLDNKVLDIKGVYVQNEGGYLTRTKNVGSFRKVDIGENAYKFLSWWKTYLLNIKPDAVYLFPSVRGNGPISDAGFLDLLWNTYAEYGLAEVVKKNGHTVVISSPLKYAPSRHFRHRLATRLIDAMHYDKALTANYIKNVIGHTRFTTTQDRYGNHTGKIIKASTAAKEKVVGLNFLKLPK